MRVALSNVLDALEKYNTQLIAELNIYRNALLAIGAIADPNAARQHYVARYGLPDDKPETIARNAIGS